MNVHIQTFSKIRLFFVLPLALLLTACNLGNAAPNPSPTPEPPTQETATPSPEPGTLILLAPAEADAGLAAEVEGLASAFANENGLLFERREALDAGEVNSRMEVIVLLPPDPGLAALAASAPETRFVAVNLEPADPLENILSLSTASAGNAEAAFIAGYTAAAVTDDWRVGVVHGAESRDLADAFVAGAEFFCGSCVPVAPPYLEYPQRAEAAGPADWQAAVDSLLAESVHSFYITPDMQSPELEQYLANWGALMLGNTTPGEAVGANWIATVGGQESGAFAQQLRMALAGAVPDQGQAVLAFAEVNRSYLSEARQAHIEEVIADLLAGFISLPEDG